MAKRFIGIDIDPSQVRVAVLEADRGAATLTAVAGRPYAGADELLPAIQELLGDPPALGDRLAAALPARGAFVRWLQFPFAEQRKLAAALPLELGSQLPVGLEDLLTDFLPPQAAGEAFRVPAVAVRKTAVAELTAAFDAAGLPLHILDLAPFALLAGLAEEFPDGVLIHLGEGATSLLLVRAGQPRDLRLLPGPPPPLAELQRAVAALRNAAAGTTPPLLLIGAGGDLAAGLRQAGETLAPLPAGSDGQPLPAEFVPALALARRAMRERERQFNFRRGPYALKSEWTALKRRLIAAGILLLVGIGAAAGSAWIDYARRAQQATALNRQMQAIFHETFPGEPLVVEVPLQMQSKIKAVEQRLGQIGTQGSQSPLAVLREVSRLTPPDVKVDISDFNFTPEALRLEGRTSAFDAVNRLARGLGGSPLFAKVQVTDSKASLTGNQVDFHLNITFSGEQEKP
jgi:type II secretory pathway component PulL